MGNQSDHSRRGYCNGECGIGYESRAQYSRSRFYADRHCHDSWKFASLQCDEKYHRRSATTRGCDWSSVRRQFGARHRHALCHGHGRSAEQHAGQLLPRAHGWHSGIHWDRFHSGDGWRLQRHVEYRASPQPAAYAEGRCNALAEHLPVCGYQRYRRQCRPDRHAHKCTDKSYQCCPHQHDGAVQ